MKYNAGKDISSRLRIKVLLSIYYLLYVQLLTHERKM